MWLFLYIFSDTNGQIVELTTKNSTVFQIQGNGITNSELIVDEGTSIRCNPMHKTHKSYSGMFDSSKIVIHVVCSDSEIKKDFFKQKRSIVEKDALLVDSLTPHPRIIRYLGAYFDSTKLEISLITDFFAGCTFEVSSCNMVIITKILN